jgi:hypothetical protein
MTTNAERPAVVYVKTQFRKEHERQNVVSIEFAAACPTFLTGEVVADKHSTAPKSVAR